jgi:hypothetical protein
MPGSAHRLDRAGNRIRGILSGQTCNLCVDKGEAVAFIDQPNDAQGDDEQGSDGKCRVVG